MERKFYIIGILLILVIALLVVLFAVRDKGDTDILLEEDTTVSLPIQPVEELYEAFDDEDERSRYIEFKVASICGNEDIPKLSAKDQNRIEQSLSEQQDTTVRQYIIETAQERCPEKLIGI